MATKAGTRWKGKEDEGYSYLIDYMSNAFSGARYREIVNKASKARTKEEAQEIMKRGFVEEWEQNASDNPWYNVQHSNVNKAVDKGFREGKIIISNKKTDKDGNATIYDFQQTEKPINNIMQKELEREISILTPTKQTSINKEVESILIGDKQSGEKLRAKYTNEELKNMLEASLGTSAVKNLKTRKQLTDEAKKLNISMDKVPVTPNRYYNLSNSDQVKVMKESGLDKLLKSNLEARTDLNRKLINAERALNRTGDERPIIALKQEIDSIVKNKKLIWGEQPKKGFMATSEQGGVETTKAQKMVNTADLSKITLGLNQLIDKAKTKRGDLSNRMTLELATGKDVSKLSSDEVLRELKKNKIGAKAQERKIVDLALSLIPEQNKTSASEIRALAKDNIAVISNQSQEAINSVWEKRVKPQSGLRNIIEVPVLFKQITYTPAGVKKLRDDITAKIPEEDPLFLAKLAEVEAQSPWLTKPAKKKRTWQLLAIETGSFPKVFDDILLESWAKQNNKDITELTMGDMVTINSTPNRELSKILAGQKIPNKTKYLTEFKKDQADNVQRMITWSATNLVEPVEEPKEE